MLLVGRSMPRVELSVISGQSSVTSDRQSAVSGQPGEERSILLVLPGLLARYNQIQFLGQLREEVMHGRRLKSCWLLLPGDNQALLDGKPVPLIGPGQKARIPTSSLRTLLRHKPCAGVSSGSSQWLSYTTTRRWSLGSEVFRNDPGQVAGWFGEYLTGKGRFAKAFEQVIFAVLDGFEVDLLWM